MNERIRLSGGSSSKNSVKFSADVVSVEASRNDDGTIETIELNPEEMIKYLNVRISDYRLMTGLCLFKELVFLFGFNNWIFHIPTVFWGVILFLGVLRLIRNPETRMYHGAEHKVAKCYQKNGELNIEQVSKFSRIHPSCGTNFVATAFSLHLFSSIFFAIWNIHIPEILICALQVFGYKYFPFNFLGLLLQIITTSEPEKRHIEVAICALTETVKLATPKAEEEHKKNKQEWEEFKQKFKKK